MIDAAALPFVAPCRKLEPGAPWRWLARGFTDLRRAPRQSLGWGALTALLSLAVCALAWRFGSYWLLRALPSLFVFVAPMLAIAPYSISSQLSRRARWTADALPGLPSHDAADRARDLACVPRRHRRGLRSGVPTLLAVAAVAGLWPRPLLATESPAAPAGPLSAATPAVPAPTLLRTSLIVADADRSIAFYRLLGFRVESDTGSQKRRVAGNPFPLNAPSARSRLVILGSASGDGGRIGLVEFADPTPPLRRDGAALVGRGDLVFVFDVADADAVHAALLAGGARVHEPPQAYVSARRAADGRPLRGKVFHAWDPDGYLVELLEAPK